MASFMPVASGGDAISESKPQGKISWQEKLDKAREFKAEANECYKMKSYSKAVGKYHRALLYIKGIESSQEPHPLGMMGGEVQADCKPTESAQQEVKKLKMDCYNNLAACLLQTDDPPYRKIVQYCDNVLEVTANVKAMYRKGISLYQLRDLEQAQYILEKANSQPEGQKDANIRKYLRLCERDLVAMNQKMKQTYQAMFQQSASPDPPTANMEIINSSSNTGTEKIDPT